MNKLIEIRWHGRGGQGAKTASQLLAQSASKVGKYIQGFPEYGPERMGAPVTAYNRISDSPIRLHCNVTNPGIVIVLDPTLIGGATDVTAGAENALYLVNTHKDPAEVRARLKISGGRVFTVDANSISQETIGRVIPNTPLMGAFIKIVDIMSIEEFIKDTKEQLEKKFANRPEIVEGNIKAIQRAYQEVKGE